MNSVSTRLRALRFVIFQIWFVTFAMLVISFFIAYSRLALPSTTQVMKSATMILALIIPSFGAILVFYGQNARMKMADRLQSISWEYFWVTILTALSYHIIFNILIYYGVLEQKLVSEAPLYAEDELIYLNCVAIVNIMGLVTFLLGPAAWVFNKGDDEEHSDPQKNISQI